jgi:peroxiredoxin
LTKLRGLAIAVCATAVCASPAAAVEVGARVPDFTATTLDGAQVSLAEAVRDHRLVVLLFLSTVCPYANHFAGHLRDLDAAYGPRGVLFIGVNSNQFESVEDMRVSAREHGHRFPLVRDEGARIAGVLGAGRTPEAFVLDGEGRVRYRGWVQSKVRSPDLQRGIDALLAGRRVRLPETKAFGCAIDRPRR